MVIVWPDGARGPYSPWFATEPEADAFQAKADRLNADVAYAADEVRRRGLWPATLRMLRKRRIRP